MRGAWIEMLFAPDRSVGKYSRAPCGARGLKSVEDADEHHVVLVAPHAGRVD